MNHRRILKYIAGIIGILILIIDSKSAAAAAADGIDLCLKSVIPSLFPLMVLTSWMTGTINGTANWFVKPIQSFCNLTPGAEVFLLSGLLGGYPVGAQCIAQAYQAKQISRTDAERMLGFCNHAGPAFLFGVSGVLFPKFIVGWALWGIQIASVLMTARILSRPANIAFGSIKTEITLSQSLKKSVAVMAVICGWIILFRILIRFLQRWVLWLFPDLLSVVVIGILELTNGCFALSRIENESVRFILCAVFMAFGGICVAIQTMTVTEGMSLKYYFLGKSVQVGLTLMISIFLVFDIRYGCISVCAMFILILLLTQKKGSVPIPVGV